MKRWTKSQTVKRKRLRKKVTNLDELKEYLCQYPDLELPFLQDAWDDAVEKAKEAKKYNEEELFHYTTDENGKQVKVPTNKRRKVENPISLYFRLMSLNKYAKAGEALQPKEFKDGDATRNKGELKVIVSDEDSEHAIVDSNQDEIMDWIDMFQDTDERVFLKKRYHSYYDTYDINEGADKAALKRLLSLEIQSYRIDMDRAERMEVNINDEKKINEMLQATLESLKWTKKQRSVRDDMAKNRFTIWMDNMVKEGKFKPSHKEYPKDDIDYLIDTVIKGVRGMFE